MADLGAALQQAINTAVQQAVQQQTGQVNTQAQSNTGQTGQTGTPVQTGQTLSQQVTQNNTGIATPTTTDVTTGMAKVGNMKTGEYTSPYQQEQQDLVGQLGDAKLYETPAETQNFLKGIFKSQTEKYDYVAENDPLVQAAREQVEDAISNMAAKRGFAFGSQTQDMISQQMAKVEPQFEQIARGEHADFLSRQMSLANVIMQWEQIQFDRSKDQIQLLTTKLEYFNKLDDRQFQIFKQMLEQRNINRSMYLEHQKFNLQKKLANQKLALDKLEQLGYVDEDASIILGVPVGTQAKWAKQMAMEQNNKLELMAKENEYNLKKQQLDYQMEKELYALKGKYDLENQLKLEAQTYEYKKKLMEIEFSKQVELKKIAEAKAAAEAAAAAARARSSGGGGYSSGGSYTSATGMTQKQLDSAYRSEASKFINRFKSSSARQSQEAARYLQDLHAIGVNPAIIARIQSTFGVPNVQKAKALPKLDASDLTPSNQIAIMNRILFNK